MSQSVVWRADLCLQPPSIVPVVGFAADLPEWLTRLDFLCEPARQWLPKKAHIIALPAMLLCRRAITQLFLGLCSVSDSSTTFCLERAILKQLGYPHPDRDWSSKSCWPPPRTEQRDMHRAKCLVLYQMNASRLSNASLPLLILLRRILLLPSLDVSLE
jgi:hypothetical protein